MNWAKKQAVAPWPSCWTWENCTVTRWILWVPSTSKRNSPKKLLLPSHLIPTHTGRACGERVTFPHPAIGLHTPLPPCPFISQTSLMFHIGLHPHPCLSLVSRYWDSVTWDAASWPPQKQRSSNKNKLTNQNQTNKQTNKNQQKKPKQGKDNNLNFEVLQEVKAVSAVLCCTYWCR